MTTYFTSDWHLGHTNIIEYCGRPFGSVDEMNQALIDRWNDTVEDDDEVYVLGDWAMGKIANTLLLTKELTGHKILIPGNHDRCWPHAPITPEALVRWTETYFECGFESIIYGPRKLNTSAGPVVLNHFPHRPTGTEKSKGKCLRCHGIAKTRSITADGRETSAPCYQCRGTGAADPYALYRVTPKPDEILLCGHVHDAWRTLDGLAVNVGVDVWDFRPVTLEEIFAALQDPLSEYVEAEDAVTA